MLDIGLHEVMTQGYLYVEDHQLTGKALGVMRDMHISCVFVLRNNVPLGIITERKVIAHSQGEKDIYSTPAIEVMTSPLKSLTPRNSVIEACNFMSKHKIRHVGIVDERSDLKGIVTPSNIVNMLDTDSFSRSARVKDVMYNEVVFADKKTTAKEIALQLLSSQSCFAVIMEDGYPMGLVSEKDICQCLGYKQDMNKLEAAKIMSKSVVGVEESEPLAQAIVSLRRHHLYRVVVYDESGKVSGLLAINGIVRNIEKVIR